MSALVFRLGDKGPAIAEVRARLARLDLLPGSSQDLHPDPVSSLLHAPAADQAAVQEPAQWDTTALISAEFDDDVEAAVRAFQADRGITVDGLVGPETFARLEEARWRLGDRMVSFNPGRVYVGDDVLELQRRLNQMGFNCGREDSHFGPLTDRALREFQRNVGLDTDGVAGPVTLRALGQLHRTVGTSSAHVARERYDLPRLQTGVAGKRIVIDPGHGAVDLGLVAAGESESAITGRVAALVEGRLAARGTQVLLTRSVDAERAAGVDTSEELTEEKRAAFCNDADADLVLSLHVSHDGGAETPASAVYYYGRSEAVFSAAGRMAAERICEAIESELGAITCAAEPRSWDLLRMTRMPAVRVDMGSMSGGGGGPLGDPQFLDALASAISIGVETFFAPAADSAVGAVR